MHIEGYYSLNFFRKIDYESQKWAFFDWLNWPSDKCQNVGSQRDVERHAGCSLPPNFMHQIRMRHLPTQSGPMNKTIYNQVSHNKTANRPIICQQPPHPMGTETNK